MRRTIPPDQIPPEVLARSQRWLDARRGFDPAAHSAALLELLRTIGAVPLEEWDDRTTLTKIVTRFARDGKGGPWSKAALVAAYQYLIAEGDLESDPQLMQRIRMKPMRTQSGVAPVTVLTAPAGCPAVCIFCPDDWRMPKSYIYDEPGAQRAERDGFDPYLQTLGRIRAFESIGHDAGKVELLILGGTWSAYSRSYRDWFVQRCLDAMNGMDDPALTSSGSLAEAQTRNQSASHRNVGLVIETRPDWITPEEIVHLRRLGVTKVQIGVQSLDDRVLDLNRRGHTVQAVREALALLRTAGFKLHVHWMPNLYGATPASDREDFARLFSDPALRPDELKIYPCSLIAGTELFARWQAGEYRPYTLTELVDLLADVKPDIPAWVRVNRLFRDIPAHHIEDGVRASNLRQLVQEELVRRGRQCGCIRCREVRRSLVSLDELALRVTRYETDCTSEYFLEYMTIPECPAPESTLPERTAPGLTAAFLRLSLPHTPTAGSRAFLPEIAGHAMIREVHVYGPALAIGGESDGAAQHSGLGTRLLDEARRLSRAAGFTHISVIAATGTRGYYAARGFTLGDLYMTSELSAQAEDVPMAQSLNGRRVEAGTPSNLS